jgi:hypothetical protein
VARAPHLKPGERAPASGTYLEHNVFGSSTGREVNVNQRRAAAAIAAWLYVATCFAIG